LRDLGDRIGVAVATSRPRDRKFAQMWKIVSQEHDMRAQRLVVPSCVLIEVNKAVTLFIHRIKIDSHIYRVIHKPLHIFIHRPQARGVDGINLHSIFVHQIMYGFI